MMNRAAGIVGTRADVQRLAKDQTWFLPIFVVKVALGLVAFAFKPALGLLFFAAYAVYFWREIRGGGQADEHDDEELEPLKLQPKAASPSTGVVVVQTVATLVVIFFASQLFVKQLDAIGPMLGLSAAVTALLLSPVAIVYLLATMRAHKLTAARLTVAAGFYAVFALGLVPMLS